MNYNSDINSGDFGNICEGDSEKILMEGRIKNLEQELKEAGEKIFKLQEEIQELNLIRALSSGPNSNSWQNCSSESKDSSNGHSSEVLELKAALEQEKKKVQEELGKDEEIKKLYVELKKKDGEIEKKNEELMKKEEQLKEKDKLVVRENEEKKEVTPKKRNTLGNLVHVELNKTLEKYKILEKVSLCNNLRRLSWWGRKVVGSGEGKLVDHSFYF